MEGEKGEGFEDGYLFGGRGLVCLLFLVGGEFCRNLS